MVIVLVAANDVICANFSGAFCESCYEERVCRCGGVRVRRCGDVKA